jgi:hypothetical protein
MTTTKERLDYLLALAGDAATASGRLARLERAVDTHPARTREGADARRDLPRARAEAKTAERRLAKSRAQFLAQLEGATP